MGSAERGAGLPVRRRHARRAARRGRPGPESGRRAFGTDQEFADRSAPLAANQGLYNGFLVAGLIWGALASDPLGFQVRVFFLACVIVAGVYGAATVNRRILFVQGVPAAVTLAVVLLATASQVPGRDRTWKPVAPVARTRLGTV